MRIGADLLDDGRCEFTLWAPLLERVTLKIVGPGREENILMQGIGAGYWRAVVRGIEPGTFYHYLPDDREERPDPASHFQPEGIRGPSQVVDHAVFAWDDRSWMGKALSEMIIYELHVGTFTPEGTFDGVVSRLDELKDLGINAIEIMPVAQFPGERNWGYDGAYPFSVHNTYGGPSGLKRLVNECHKRDIAIVLDVVYNHIGPEGNHFNEFGPYFTDTYRTPWGRAMNFDGPYSDGVRNFFIENALHWFGNYHIDALRLDAVHAIYDSSATHILKALKIKTEEFSKEAGRNFFLIAESDLNDPAVMRSRSLGGYGMDAGWCDDFHHCLHTLLTGERDGYYVDFGDTGDLVKSLREGFVYSGRYSKYRKKSFGAPSTDIPAERFVVFSQNHDQVGNRFLGERLPALVPFEALKLAAGVVVLSPYVPLIFMGEEYGEDSPFLFFISHSDRDVIEATRKGRKEEFRAFNLDGEPPDPQSVDTFLRSRLCWDKRSEGRHRVLLDFYKKLISLRKDTPALCALDKDNLDATCLEREKVLFMRRWNERSHIFAIFNFNEKDILTGVTLPEGRWERVLDSKEAAWQGPGTGLPELLDSGEELNIKGHSLSVYRMEELL